MVNVHQSALALGLSGEFWSQAVRPNAPVRRWPSLVKYVNEPNGFSTLGTCVRVNEGPKFGRRTECEQVG